jgi:hypothetical protein
LGKSAYGAYDKDYSVIIPVIGRTEEEIKQRLNSAVHITERLLDNNLGILSKRVTGDALIDLVREFL